MNVYFAMLERKVGLCSVVKTAANLGVTWVNGKSLFDETTIGQGGPQSSADNTPSFTLGSIAVSPMSMAAAYATVAARGVYCHPIAISAIVTRTGASSPWSRPAATRPSRPRSRTRPVTCCRAC